MNNFKVENNGNITNLVYEFEKLDKVNSVGLGMIENNNIKGILPMVYTQLNNERLLKYNITSKVPMSFLFDRSVNKRIVANCFINIVKTITLAEDYMLDMDSFVIDMEYIYVNVSSYETELIYLPLLNDEKKLSLKTFFKNILFSGKFDQSENCDYVIKLISYLNGDKFSLKDFTKLLEEILGIRAIEKETTESHRENNNQEAFPGKTTVDATAFNNSFSGGVAQQLQPKINVANSNNNLNNNEGNLVNNKEVMSGNRAPNLIPVQDGSIVKENKKNKKAKKKGGLFGKKDSNTQVQQMAIPGVPQSLQNGNLSEEKVNIKNQTTMKVPGNREIINSSINNSLNAPVISQTNITQTSGNFGETTVLNAMNQFSGETTVLGVGSGQVLPRACLIRKKNQEKKYIDKDTFRIGKENSFVDYFIGDNTAISRSHANIINKGSDYYIVDMNSKNHTYINGRIIPSNIEETIESGMIIKLADEEFEFIISY